MLNYLNYELKTLENPENFSLYTWSAFFKELDIPLKDTQGAQSNSPTDSRALANQLMQSCIVETHCRKKLFLKNNS